MKLEVSLSDEQKVRHNELYSRANELQNGLVMLDDKPQKNPGFFGKRLFSASQYISFGKCLN